MRLYRTMNSEGKAKKHLTFAGGGLGYWFPNHLKKAPAMSDVLRPAAILASVLDLHRLATFVQMRSLVLAETPEQIELLEKQFNLTQTEAQDYFIHFHEWQERDRQFLQDETNPLSNRIAALRMALDASTSQPLIPRLPEA